MAAQVEEKCMGLAVHTLVDTSLNTISYLISEFFHLKLGGSRCLVLSMHASSSCDGGGEEQQASAVEFPAASSICVL